MLLFTLLLCIHSVCSTVRAAALPEPEPYTLPTRDVSVISPPVKTDLELFVRKSTTDGGGLSVIKPRVSDAVAIAGITAVKEIAVAACANPWVCALFIVTAAIIGFYAIHKYLNDQPSYGGGTFTPTRSLASNSSYNIHSHYAPTADCNTACQLQNKAPRGEWTSIGNVTVDGVFHHLHHFHNGTTRGLRATQSSNSTVSASRNRRRNPYDQVEHNGMVGDFYWSAPNNAAYGSYHSNPYLDNEAAQDITNFMQRGNFIEVCVDFSDQDGLLDSGLIALGWNGEPFIFNSQADLDAQISRCGLGNIYRGEDGPSESDNL